MMRLAETHLTDTSMCHLGPVTRSLFQSQDLKVMESELLIFLASWTKLAVTVYDAFISVLASAGVI